MKEKCGLVAIYSLEGKPITPLLMRALEALQHRGQESWGIKVAGHPTLRRMGLIGSSLPSLSRILSWSGAYGIGHTRYSTKGRSNLLNAHPIDIEGEFSIAQNGTIANYEELFELIRGEFDAALSDTDTKLLGLRLLHHLRRLRGDWFAAFEAIREETVGSYCLVLLDRKGRIYAVRDPKGFRPLCLGWHEESSSYIVASESCALDAIDAELLRDVEPGEVVKLDREGLISHRFAPRTNPSHCSFEYTYFAHPSSKLDGIVVYEARKRIGQLLAERFPLQGDVVIPVPDSARPAALGYSSVSGIALEEGLMKDRYRIKGSMRSFIEPDQRSRAFIVKQMIPISSTIRGKEVVLVDDSIVRGTSSKQIVRSLKRAGAKSVKMVVTFPPIRYPCYMGIDFPSQEELLAYRVAKGKEGADLQSLAKMVGERIGVEELVYNDLEGLSEGIGLALDQICSSCYTGDYSCLGCPVMKFRTRLEMKR